VWFSEETIEGWRAEARSGRGGQPKYSNLAIVTALTLRAVFHLALRQTEGLIGFIFALLGLNLAVCLVRTIRSSHRRIPLAQAPG
jgi:Transposase DDE domain